MSPREFRLALGRFWHRLTEEKRLKHPQKLVVLSALLQAHAKNLGLQLWTKEQRANYVPWLDSEWQTLEEAMAPLIRQTLGQFEQASESMSDALKQDLSYPFDCLFWGTDNYPSLLPNIPRPPLVIWTAGPGLHLIENFPRAAVVGSRKATAYGEKIAGMLARKLAALEFCLYSGLARGIDALSQAAMVEAGGATVGVLGGGFYHPYPKSSWPLIQKLMKEGLVLALFPPEVAPKPWHFPLRNHLIAGLSQAVFVVEAGKKSGSMITARAAIDYGRDLWVVPGSVFKNQSYGCHELLAEGADILYDLSLIDQMGEASLTYLQALEAREKETKIELPSNERKVLQLLSDDNLTDFALAVKLQQPLEQIQAVIGSLLLQGFLKNQAGNYSLTVKGMSAVYEKE